MKTSLTPPRPIRLPRREGQQDITLSVYDQGEGPAVVFCHGFPELGYSWRHQLPALASAGFRAIAPDQRGYGGSTCPEKIEDYSVTELCADLVGLLDVLEIEKAAFVGHDWGGFVSWAMPVLHADRVAAAVGVCTPYSAMPPTEDMRARLGGIEDERFYILWFQKPGVAEKVLDAETRLLFDSLMRGGVAPEKLLERAFVDGKPHMNPFNRLGELEPLGDLIVSPEELDTYVHAFERTSFRGGINWYRNIDRNAAEHPEVGVKPLDLPCLMLTAEWDMALRPELAEGMPALCSDLEMYMIPKAGHWVQQEYPEELNAHLIPWLQKKLA